MLSLLYSEDPLFISWWFLCSVLGPMDADIWEPGRQWNQRGSQKHEGTLRIQTEMRDGKCQQPGGLGRKTVQGSRPEALESAWLHLSGHLRISLGQISALAPSCKYWGWQTAPAIRYPQMCRTPSLTLKLWTHFFIFWKQTFFVQYISLWAPPTPLSESSSPPHSPTWTYNLSFSH